MLTSRFARNMTRSTSCPAVRVASMTTTPIGPAPRRRGPSDGKGRKGKRLADDVSQVDFFVNY